MFIYNYLFYINFYLLYNIFNDISLYFAQSDKLIARKSL